MARIANRVVRGRWPPGRPSTVSGPLATARIYWKRIRDRRRLADATTLLEILAGLRAPSAGQVTHDGVPVDARATRHSGIGYVPRDDIIRGEMPLRIAGLAQRIVR